jgi:hypothetical protein
VRWVLRRNWDQTPSAAKAQPVGLAIGASALVTLAWFSPIVRAFPLATGGDVALHAGWTEQLLNGEAMPSSPLTGDVPNYYPWLYHALLAVVTHLTPEGHPFEALAPLQILQVLGVAAALFAVGHQLAGRWCGCATALLGAAAGGWGFFLARGAELVVDPRREEGSAATRYAGDLLRVRSYNVSFQNLTPPYPRDVALALLIGVIVLLVRAGRTGRGIDYALAGVVLGLVGLTQTDAFLVGLLAALLVAGLAPAGRRLRTGATTLVPAALMFLLWAGPIAWWYARLGGFVDVTRDPPVEMPVWAILGGWGIVTPLAGLGAVRAYRLRGDSRMRVVIAVLFAAALVLAGSALVPALLGEGFETIGRDHRYWPLLCLGLALLAGQGAYLVGVRVQRRSPAGVWALAAALVLVALPSPLLASWALPSKVPLSDAVVSGLRGNPHSGLALLRDYGEGGCSVATPLSWRAFAYTGFHQLLVGDPGRQPNAARIRWADIYEQIVPESERVRDDALLNFGSVTDSAFQAIVARYGLDAVVVPADAASGEAFRDLSGTPVRAEGEDLVLFGLDEC